MKFLIVLSVLASTTAFANEEYIKCWDTAQEEGGKPAYVFKIKALEPALEEPYKQLFLVKPFYTLLESKHGCLKTSTVTADSDPNWIKFCKGEGQHRNGLIPVEVEEREWDGTVYCERDLKRWFFRGGYDGGSDGGYTGGTDGGTDGGYTGGTSGGTSGGYDGGTTAGQGSGL